MKTNWRFVLAVVPLSFLVCVVMLGYAAEPIVIRLFDWVIKPHIGEGQ